jgi:SAM-dependent methyltransferase
MPDQPIYNKIGLGYNTTRQADPYLVGRIHQFLSPQKNKFYLDIGCGTGNYTVALANLGLQLTGVDPSEIMLEEARKKSNLVEWKNGSSEQIPASNNSFDGALATLTLHHWKDIPSAFKELYRVLKPKSKLVFFTSSPAQMQGYWLNHYFPRLIEVSGKNMPAVESIEIIAPGEGFILECVENYFVKPDLKDLFLYSGKHNPELYFNEHIRKGISTFSVLSNKEEIENGLNHLRTDLDSGKFQIIKERYENDLGDYCFVVFEKT